MELRNYLLNCFLLLIPILLWNMFLSKKLPKEFQKEIFWKDIPRFISVPEHSSRIVLFMMMIIMPIDFSTQISKLGFGLYILGSIVYYGSWLMLIYFPKSVFSRSFIGFMSPSFTPFIWLLGIGLIGNSFLFDISYHYWYYFLVGILFLFFHNYHAFIIYKRQQKI